MTVELSKTEVLAMNGLRRSGWSFEPDSPTAATTSITITSPEEFGQDDAMNTETLAEMGWEIDMTTETLVLCKSFT
jgi:hypothetical protein